MFFQIAFNGCRALRALAFSLGLASLAVPVHAQQAMEIFSLKHRLPDHVLPAVQMAVAPDGAVSAMNNKLVVRGSPAAIARVRQTLAALDTPLRRLMISVQQGDSLHDSRSAAGLGDVRIEVDGDGVRGRAEAGLSARSGHASRDSSQRVQTLEGGSASIFVGQSIAVPVRQIVRGPGGAVIAESVQYLELGNGFVATPQLTGDGRVTLSIAPQSTQLNAAGISASAMRTSVSGALGDWIVLGGSVQTQSSQGTGAAAYSSAQSKRQMQTWIRVEALD